MKDKLCKICGKEFLLAAPAQLYCVECKLQSLEAEKLKNKTRAYNKRRERGCRIGRGALPADLHPNYKHGFYVAQTQSSIYRNTVKYCERCHKDLLVVSRWHWVMHHKDHNHANFSSDNLELLCKSCHAIEHKAADKLNVQRLGESRSPK